MLPKFNHSHVAFYFLLVLHFTSGCKGVERVNSKTYNSEISTVDLHEYKSVQLRNDGQDSKLALGVAISGGGSRAEYFGLGVLLMLEEAKSESNSNFLQDIDYFSTVSGGGFAGGYYVMVKKKFLNTGEFKSFHDFWYSPKHLTKRSTLDEIRYNASPFKLLINPLREANMAGGAFTRKLNRQLLHNNKIKLNDIFIKDPTKPVNLPMLIANGTILNSTQRVPFIPSTLDKLKIQKIIRPWWHGRKLPASDQLNIKDALAASSDFPGVIPPLKLAVRSTSPLQKRNSRIRILDGGIVDNLGYASLFEALCHDSTKVDRTKALIIDCSEGQDDWYSERWISTGNLLLNHALFFTLTSKYSELEEAMKNKAKKTCVADNYFRIGISNLRDRARETYKELVMANDTVITSFMEQGEWHQLYEVLDTMIANRLKPRGSSDIDVQFLEAVPKTHSGKEFNMMKLKSNAFSEFDGKIEMMIYELASKVKTNVKIGEREKCILVLCGRYTAWMELGEQGEITRLYRGRTAFNPSR